MKPERTVVAHLFNRKESPELRTLILFVLCLVFAGCSAKRTNNTTTSQDVIAAPNHALTLVQQFTPADEEAQWYLAGDPRAIAFVQSSRMSSAFEWAITGYLRAYGHLPATVDDLLESGLVLFTPTRPDGTPYPFQVVQTLPEEPSTEAVLLAKEGAILRGWLPPVDANVKARRIYVNLDKRYQMYNSRQTVMPTVPQAVLANRVAQQASIGGLSPGAFANQFLHQSDGLEEQRAVALLAASIGLMSMDAQARGRVATSLEAVLQAHRLAFRDVATVTGNVDLLDYPLGVQLRTSTDRNLLQIAIKPSIEGLDYQLLKFMPDYSLGRVTKLDLSGDVAPQEAGCHDLVATLVLQ